MFMNGVFEFHGEPHFSGMEGVKQIWYNGKPANVYRKNERYFLKPRKEEKWLKGTFVVYEDCAYPATSAQRG